MLLPYQGHSPRLGAGVFIAPSADVIGQVILGEDASVFFQCVLRGDINAIRVGARTNIQDQSTVHVADGFPAVLGDDVSVGHGCLVHACTVGDRVLVGMGSVILDGAVVGDDSLIGAGSLLPKGKDYPPGSLILGRPAKVLRPLTEEEKTGIAALARKYVGLKNRYLSPLPG